MGKPISKKEILSNPKNNQIEQKIITNDAVRTIQSIVRTRQAKKKADILRVEKAVTSRLLEEFIVKGDLPADHAYTLRQEGTFSAVQCRIVQYSAANYQILHYHLFNFLLYYFFRYYHLRSFPPYVQTMYLKTPSHRMTQRHYPPHSTPHTTNTVTKIDQKRVLFLSRLGTKFPLNLLLKWKQLWAS
jgi:hypothetical protein